MRDKRNPRILMYQCLKSAPAGDHWRDQYRIDTAAARDLDLTTHCLESARQTRNISRASNGAGNRRNSFGERRIRLISEPVIILYEVDSTSRESLREQGKTRRRQPLRFQRGTGQ